MPDHTFLAHLVVTYAIALVLVVGLARVRVPTIVTMMLAGVVAGPSGLRVISTAEEVETLAELGIVFLLFTVGLDFSLAAVKQIWRTIVTAGTLQIIVTAMVVAGSGDAGRRRRCSLRSSSACSWHCRAPRSSSSWRNGTALGAHGRLTVGILLLQDLAIVVLLLLVLILSGQTPDIGRATGAGLRAPRHRGSRRRQPDRAAATPAARHRERPAREVPAGHSRGQRMAWIGSLMGLSMAQGAFLAGLMLAESEFSHQAYAEVRPIRDMLSGLFFISLGMLIDLGALVGLLPVVAGVTAAIIVLKAAIATGSLLAASSPTRVAIISGLAVAQVGSSRSSSGAPDSIPDSFPETCGRSCWARASPA